MYETIMDLPLFKGVSAAQVSNFIEKTKIDFLKYEPGDIIVEAGEEVKKLKFILKGKIRLTNLSPRLGIEVSSCFVGRESIGATRLFGIHPHYEYTIEAVTPVSVMEFSKENYMTLLRSDKIYLLNFANLLSLNLQRYQNDISAMCLTGVIRLIVERIALFTTRTSTDITLRGLDIFKKKYNDPSLDKILDELERRDILALNGDTLEIKDRAGLIEYASDLDNVK